MVRNCVLGGKGTGEVTRRYVVGGEAGWVLVGQLLCFKVEVDCVWLEGTEGFVCLVG